MIRNILLFDIDNTIFDTKKFRKITNDKISLFIRNEEQIYKYKNIAQGYLTGLNSSTDFNIDEYIQLLSDKLQINKKCIEDIYKNDRSLYKECLYSDVLNVLKILFKGHILGIYSEGYESFQLDKLVKSDIVKYFDKKYIFIRRRKLESNMLTDISLHCTLIDDKLNILKNMTDINCIWINRKTQENDQTIRTIHNLNELLAIY